MAIEKPGLDKVWNLDEVARFQNILFQLFEVNIAKLIIVKVFFNMIYY